MSDFDLKATTKNIIDRPAMSVEQIEAKAAKVGKEKLTRTTIDMPVDLHRNLKLKAVTQGVSIRDYVIALIEKDIYPEG